MSSHRSDDALRDLIGLGAGGHARVLADLVRKRGGSIHGYLAPGASGGQTVAGPPLLGDDSLLPQLFEEGFRRAFIGLGSVRASRARLLLADLCRRCGFELPVLIDLDAIVSTAATLDEGAQVLPGAIINTDVHVGRAAIINSGAIIEHDCFIGQGAHVSPGARLGGDVGVGDGAHVGMGAVVLQGLRIGDDATVGAGAVVIADVPAGVTVVGVPARRL